MEFMSIDQIIKHLPSDSRDVWKGGMSFHSGILGSFGILCRTCNLMACGLGGGEVFIWGVYIIKSLKVINLPKGWSFGNTMGSAEPQRRPLLLLSCNDSWQLHPAIMLRLFLCHEPQKELTA